MVKVVAQNVIKPEHLDVVKPLFRQLIEATHKEEGCISYILYEDVNDPTCFVFIEEWKSQAALDAHMASPHFTSIIPQIREYAAKPSAANILKEF